MIDIVVIVGPTAVGKSEIAVKLAKKYDGEIVSADSRQVYKGLDIGTGKITKKEMAGMPHHMLDIENPQKQFSVVKYVRLSEKIIESIYKRGNLPIVCGGTGFYVNALVDGIILPDVPPNKKLREKMEKMSVEKLFNILNKLDKKRAGNIDRNNKRRIIRAIEIAKTLGKVPSIKNSPQKYNPVFIGINMSKEKLKENIKIRLEKRIKQGMIEEANKLHDKGLSWKRMYELGLEYRYLSLYLQNKITKEEMIRKLETEIWHYAKRQITWFKKDKRIKWI